MFTLMVVSSSDSESKSPRKTLKIELGGTNVPHQRGELEIARATMKGERPSDNQHGRHEVLLDWLEPPDDEKCWRYKTISVHPGHKIYCPVPPTPVQSLPRSPHPFPSSFSHPVSPSAPFQN